MVEPLQRVDRLGGRLMDVDQPLVGADLEVLARVLVLERRPDHAVHVLLRGQRHGTGDGRAGARRGLDDLLGRRLDRRVVIGLQADADLVLGDGRHVFSVSGSRVGTRAGDSRPGAVSIRIWQKEAAGPGSRTRRRPANYWMISVTTPEPTVRPPSRIAKRRPWSMAIGWMSSISMVTLSPGMTISVPSGRLATPVTSVVRK